MPGSERSGASGAPPGGGWLEALRRAGNRHRRAPRKRGKRGRMADILTGSGRYDPGSRNDTMIRGASAKRFPRALRRSAAPARELSPNPGTWFADSFLSAERKGPPATSYPWEKLML